MTEEIVWSKFLYYRIRCNKCSSIVEFSPPAVIPEQVKVDCYNCQAINTVEKEQLSHFEDAESLFTSSSPTNGTMSGGKRNRKTNESPLSTEFYDLLEVSPTATQAEIRRKYYALAMKYRLDKCSDPDAEEKFKKISQVYQVLSDEKLRQKYNEFGPNPTTAPEGGFAELELFINQCFIGERFVDIVGEIRFTRDIRNILINGEEENRVQLSPEEKKLKNKIDSEKRDHELNERINDLAKNLIDKMGSYTEHESRDSEEKFRQKIIYEVEELKYESFGVELLHAIGNIYSLKAKSILDSQQSHNILNFSKEIGHFFTDTNSELSDINFAIKLETQLQKINISLRDSDINGIDQAEKIQLVQEFATKRINFMWQRSRLEVIYVILQVCNRVLDGTAIPKSRLMSRARGLKIIGDLYLTCESIQPPTKEVPHKTY